MVHDGEEALNALNNMNEINEEDDDGEEESDDDVVFEIETEEDNEEDFIQNESNTNLLKNRLQKVITESIKSVLYPHSAALFTTLSQTAKSTLFSGI